MSQMLTICFYHYSFLYHPSLPMLYTVCSGPVVAARAGSASASRAKIRSKQDMDDDFGDTDVNSLL